MIQTKEKGMHHIAPIAITDPALQTAVTSPTSESQTRYINPVTVSFKDGQENVILCDTPGFGDSSGPKVDIANGIGIIKAFQGSKSVKPIVLISLKGLSKRLEGLRELLQTLFGIIPNLRSQLNTFSDSFTKSAANDRDHLRASLVNLRDSLNSLGESDGNLIALLEDILRKFDKPFLLANLDQF